MSECIWPVASSRTIVREDGVAAPNGPLRDAILASARGRGMEFLDMVRVCGRPTAGDLCGFHAGPAVDAVRRLINEGEIRSKQLRALLHVAAEHPQGKGLLMEILNPTADAVDAITDALKDHSLSPADVTALLKAIKRYRGAHTIQSFVQMETADALRYAWSDAE